MQSIVTCGNAMFQHLSKIGPKIQIFYFDTYHTETLHLREKGFENLCLFVDAKRGT